MFKRHSLSAAFLLGTSTVAAIAALPTVASAQVTAASANGVVVTNSGAPVANATVTFTDTRTGRTSRAQTSGNGTFFETGLAVGGPYTINIQSADGTLVRENIRLQPSTNTLNFVIEGIDEVVTTATIQSGADIGDGVGSAFSAEDIANQPTATRDLIATLVRDPLANSTGEGILSVAGANPRFNALAIDGSLQQDDFGLSSSTYPTARVPVSLDVIESATVVATDYSVTQSGFTGGLVNVVTKSGTNEFDGAAYWYIQDESFFGTSVDEDGDIFSVAPFEEDEYGFVLSGPIIKDKLFFLASYDKFESGSGREFSAADADDGINPQLYTELANIVQSQYGFDIGQRETVVSLPITSERILGKLDWNINDSHRASFTYQDTQENGFSGVGQTTFSSAYYQTPTDLKAYTAQLFSDWSDNLSTELRINFKDYERGQICNAGATVGSFEIELSQNDLIGTDLEGLISEGGNSDIGFLGGCDRFRQGNTFADERLQIQGIGRYNLGDHLISFGAEYQNYELDNLFAQRSVGQFEFDTVAGLENGLASTVTVQLPDTGVQEDIRAVWGYDQLALFLQDSWQITPEFRLDAGLRYETIIQSDEPQERTFFGTRYGFPNTQNLDGNDLLMPRVSFEWNPLERTSITGGFGLYGGGDPKVWTSNAFTPPVFFERLRNVSGVNPANGTPQALLDAVTSNDANDPGPIDVISPDFETPSDWKASLRLDQSFDLAFNGADLGEDYNLSLAVIYTNNKNGFGWRNLAQTNFADTAALGVAPDGRPIYADLDDLRINNAIALVNIDQGDSWVYTASLSKDWDNGLGAYFSYAYQDVDLATAGSSSRGVSNLRAIVDSDRNFATPGTSPYATEHAFKIGLTYDTDVFWGLDSQFSLFGNIRSGDRFSYTFDIDRNAAMFGRQGDFENPFDNDLLYIPNISGGVIDDPNVVVGSGFDEAGFVSFVDAAGLEQGISEKNGDASGWNQQWDFQWTQELPFFNKQAEQFVGENKLKFVFNIDNVANFINSDWGTQNSGPGFDTVAPVAAELVSRADVAANGVDGASTLRGDDARTTCTTVDACVYRFSNYRDRDTSFDSLFRSVYQIRVGLRYEF
jgi:hypothetical protein